MHSVRAYAYFFRVTSFFSGSLNVRDFFPAVVVCINFFGTSMLAGYFLIKN